MARTDANSIAVRAGFPAIPSARPALARAPDKTVLRYTYPAIPDLSYWGVDAVKTALDNHDRGFFWHSGLLEDQLERNPRIAAALSTRTLGVLGLPFAVEPSQERSRTRKRAAREIAEIWSRIAPQEVLAEMLRNLVMLGFSVAEVLWTAEPTRRGARWVPVLSPVHPVFVRWDRYFERFVVNAFGEQIPITPGNGRWVVLQRTRRWGWLRGVLRCLALQDAMRSYAVRDWARYSEKHGLPILRVKVPMEADARADEVLEDSLAELGNESTLTLPVDKEGKGFDADFIEPKADTWQAFEGLIRQVDSDVSIAILGQNLTTQVSSGSLAAARVHDKVRQDYLESDVSVLAQGLRAQLLVPWAHYNYGSREAAPQLVWNTAPPEDLKVASATQSVALKNLRELRALGVKVDETAYLERFGITAIEIEEPEPEPESGSESESEPGVDSDAEDDDADANAESEDDEPKRASDASEEDA